MEQIEKFLKKAHSSSKELQQAGNGLLKKVLIAIAALLEKESGKIIKENKRDISKLDDSDLRADRLLLTPGRISNIAGSIRKIASLHCPAGRLSDEKVLPNGLILQNWTVPLGVVGVVYESRPNVTFDIAALCLRSKNACVLKGSREALHTNRIAVKLIHQVLKEYGLPTSVVTLLPPEREVLDQLFTATKYIDVLIPRGSAGLIDHVRKNSRVPVIETGAGVCHVYVEKDADLAKAVAIVENAKLSRPSVCNAIDTILIDDIIAAPFLEKLLPEFKKNKVVIYTEPRSGKLFKEYPYLHIQKDLDYGTEYLSLKCAVKIVNNIDEALSHISEYSTRHSEAIVSKNKKTCQKFIEAVDAAVVYSNASTRFTDGEEFGLGAEIGVSTQKLHARGPFALEKLVTEKWVVKGDGQVRK
jgi:glutamate-5-semialdehyde dehydrogenase